MATQLRRVRAGEVIRSDDWNLLASTVENLEVQVAALQQLVSVTASERPVGTITMGQPVTVSPSILPPFVDFEFRVDVGALSVAEAFTVVASATPATFTPRALTAGGQPLTFLHLAATQGAAYNQRVRVRVDLPAASSGVTGSVSLRLTSVRNAQLTVQSLMSFTVGQAPPVSAFPITGPAMAIPVGQMRQFTITLGDNSTRVPVGNYNITYTVPAGWSVVPASFALGAVLQPSIVQTAIRITSPLTPAQPTDSLRVAALDVASGTQLAQGEFVLTN